MAELPRPRGALVVAVDGVLAESLHGRGEALLAGAYKFGLLERSADTAHTSQQEPPHERSTIPPHERPTIPSHTQPTIPAHTQPTIPPHELIVGRSWSEAVRLLPDVPADETLLDLAAHAAEQEWTHAMNRGLPIVDTAALQRCRAAVQAGWRLILRADSTRSSSAALFTFLEEETGAVRCISGDDPGVLSMRGMSVLSSQYAGIITASSARGNGFFVEPEPVRLRLGGAIARYLSAGWPAG